MLSVAHAALTGLVAAAASGPAQYAGAGGALEVYFDPRYGLTHSGDQTAVTAATEQSANAISGTIVGSPIYEATGFNGEMPCVRMDGAACIGFDAAAAAMSGEDKPFVLVMAVQMLSKASGKYPFHMGHSTINPSSVYRGMNVASSQRWYPSSRDDSFYVKAAVSEVNSLTTETAIVTWVFSGTEATLYINGNLDSVCNATPQDVGNITLDRLTFGAARGSVPASYANMRLGIALVFSGASVDRVGAESWVASQGYHERHPTGYGSDLKCWLDGKTLTLGAFSSGVWADKSGNGNDATPVGSPNVDLTSFGSNYRSVVLNGSSQYLSVNSLASLMSGDDNAVTVMVVAKFITNDAAYRTLWAFGNSGNATPVAYCTKTATAGGGMRLHKHDDATGLITQTGSLATDTSAHTFCAVIPGTTASDWTNGKPDLSSVAYNVGTTTLDMLTIGALKYGAAITGYANLAVVEVRVWNRALTTAERLREEKELKAKWGIALDSMLDVVDLSAFQAHHKADRGVTIATGVSVWFDNTGNGRNWVQATAGVQPARSAGTGPGGHDEIVSTGSKWMTVPGWILPDPSVTPTLLVAAMKWNSWTNNASFCGSYSPAFNNGLSFMQSNNVSPASPDWMTYNGTLRPADATIAIGTYSLDWGYFSGSYATDYRRRSGGSEVFPGSVGNHAPTGDRVLFGRPNAATPTGIYNPGDASIVELSHFNRDLFPHEKADVLAYNAAAFSI